MASGSRDGADHDPSAGMTAKVQHQWIRSLARQHIIQASSTTYDVPIMMTSLYLDIYVIRENWPLRPAPRFGKDAIEAAEMFAAAVGRRYGRGNGHEWNGDS